MINLILLAFICSCWVIGGQWKGRIRDLGVPILLGIGIYLLTKSWIVALVSAGAYNTIRIGYGNYSPEDDDKPSFLASLTHDRDGWWIRALWGFIVAVVGCFALFQWHFIGLPKYILYVVGNVAINYSVSRFRLPIIITDILVSAGIGSIIFLI